MAKRVASKATPGGSNPSAPADTILYVNHLDLSSTIIWGFLHFFARKASYSSGAKLKPSLGYQLSNEKI